MKPIPVKRPDQLTQSDFQAFVKDEAGAVLVETAIVMPILIVMLMGIVSYAQYSMIAHSVQQAANEAARAAVVGLDEADRVTLVRSSVAASLKSAGGVDRTLVSSAVKRAGEFYTVTVTYDLERNASLKSTAIVPLPVGAISRHATVKLVEF